MSKVILGITGGIATGKSTVLRILSEAGIPTISSDDLAHKAILKGTLPFKAIEERFGKSVICRSGQIDRQKLGKIVFKDQGARKWLEKKVHPVVIKGLKDFIRSHHGVIALDIPLLFEVHLERLVDKIVVVYAPKTLQIKRLARRNHLTRQEALQRIAAQMPLSRKVRRADIVIRNTGTLGDLQRYINHLLSN